MISRLFRILVVFVVILSLGVPAVYATGADFDPVIDLQSRYHSVDLLDGAYDFKINGESVSALGAVSVAGAVIDFSWNLSMATYLDYVVVRFVYQSDGVLPEVGVDAWQSDFHFSTPDSVGDDTYLVTIPFSGVIPSGLTVRFDFGGSVYAPLSIQSVVGYVGDVVTVSDVARIDYRPYVSTNASSDWSTLTKQVLPWNRTFYGYKDPLSEDVNSYRSGIDLFVFFDFSPVRWADKIKFSFSFPYRFVQDPDTLEWVNSDELFAFGVFLDYGIPGQSGYKTVYPDVSVAKHLEYQEQSADDFAPNMVYTFTVDVSGYDLAYSKLRFDSRFYGFSSVEDSAGRVMLDCHLSPFDWYVADPVEPTWLSSVLGAVSDGFKSVTDTLRDLLSSDDVQDSADALYEGMASVDDFVEGEQYVVDQYVPDMLADTNNVIYENAGAFGFIGSTLTNFARNMQGLDIVLTLPIVIGIFCALCQRLPGATSSIKRISKDD